MHSAQVHRREERGDERSNDEYCILQIIYRTEKFAIFRFFFVQKLVLNISSPLRRSNYLERAEERESSRRRSSSAVVSDGKRT